MKRFCAAAAVCFLVACGGSPEDCRDIEPSGTYSVRWREQSGDCGDIPDSQVNLDSLAFEPGVGCELISLSTSDNECRADIDIACESTADDIRLRETGYLEIQDDDASEISGKITISGRRLSNNSFICSSTYEVTYSKD
jgi:hypothetical protein